MIDKDKPAVYVSFLDLREIKPDDPTDDAKNLFFKVTNNTNWNIWLQMSEVSKKEYGDASLYYEIKNDAGTFEIGSTQCHVCSVNPVGSGQSLIFSIPLNQAESDRNMKIAYSFEWERDNEHFDGSFASHFVTYSFYYLPESILPKKKKPENDGMPQRNLEKPQ